MSQGLGNQMRVYTVGRFAQVKTRKASHTELVVEVAVDLTWSPDVADEER